MPMLSKLKSVKNLTSLILERLGEAQFDLGILVSLAHSRGRNCRRRGRVRDGTLARVSTPDAGGKIEGRVARRSAARNGARNCAC